jgi:OFA family oxalate/formate antiporter-like MFS transporter
MATPNRKTVTSNDLPNRWGIAIAGIVMQIALGAVYAWSVFGILLSKTFGWTIPQVTFTFTLAIFS